MKCEYIVGSAKESWRNRPCGRQASFCGTTLSKDGKGKFATLVCMEHSHLVHDPERIS